MKTEHSTVVGGAFAGDGVSGSPAASVDGSAKLRTVGKSSVEKIDSSLFRLGDAKGTEAITVTSTPSADGSRERPADNKIPRKRKRLKADSLASDVSSVEPKTHADADKICWVPAVAIEPVPGCPGAANISDGSDEDDDPHLHSPITDVREPQSNLVECA